MGKYIGDPEGILGALGIAAIGIGAVLIGLGDALGCLTDEGKDEAIKMIENIFRQNPDDNAALLK
jgi:hypothetical protein